MSELQGIARLKIRDGKLEEFTRFAGTRKSVAVDLVPVPDQMPSTLSCLTPQSVVAPSILRSAAG